MIESYLFMVLGALIAGLAGEKIYKFIMLRKLEGDIDNLERNKKSVLVHYKIFQDAIVRVNVEALIKDRKELEEFIEKNNFNKIKYGYHAEITVTSFKRTSRFLGSGLLSAILKNMLAEAGNKSKIDRNAVISALVTKKIKSDSKTYIFLLLAFFLYIPLVKFGVVGYSPYCLFLPVLLFFGLTLNHRVLEYRIVKGYYGRTAYEAREILQFISTNNDGGNFGGGKKLFQEPEQEVETSLEWHGEIVK